MNNSFIEVFIRNQESNYYVNLPNKAKLEYWKRLQKSIEDNEGIGIYIDTLSHGCGGVAICFNEWGEIGKPAESQMDDGKAFGFNMSRENLKELITCLQFAYETSTD